MEHHWADFLDRRYGHWSISPNAERQRYAWPNLHTLDRGARILTITSATQNWQMLDEFAELEELTLHEVSPEQISLLEKLPHLKRLRITHARPSSLEILKEMHDVKELVLEYVSGFQDMSPIGQMRSLRSLHTENLRRASDFSGLSKASRLKYLGVWGTSDWKQPIEELSFLSSLDELEYLSLGTVQLGAPTGSIKVIAELPSLKHLHLGPKIFELEDYAMLEALAPHLDGIPFEPVQLISGISYYPLGKGNRSFNAQSKAAAQRRDKFVADYARLVSKYRNQ